MGVGELYRSDRERGEPQYLDPTVKKSDYDFPNFQAHGK